MITKEAIVHFYSDKTNGIHRFNDEGFYQLEAREKLFHMGSGASLLDFGCGSADLLVYYAPHFERMLGCDISDNMVTRARGRLAQFAITNASVEQADEIAVWRLVAGQRFDFITSAGVMQYLSESQIRLFLGRARDHLNLKGRITLFDLVDPRVYWLAKYGWFQAQPMGLRAMGSGLKQSSKIVLRKLIRSLANRPEDHMGFSHHPSHIEAVAQAEGYRVRFVRSMYYEYRYHALLEQAP